MTIPRLLRGLRKKRYRALLVDPPWYFRGHTKEKSDRDPRNHYATMSLDAIKALPIGDYLARDCHLFLWVTGPFMEKAFEVIRAWGFKYSGMGFTWVKLKRSWSGIDAGGMFGPDDFHTGLGFTTRKNCEFVLLARRGNPVRVARNVRELVISPVREHSRKPDEVRERIERYCPGPYLELFARSGRRGWTSRGRQMGMFGGRKPNRRAKP